MCFFIIFFDLDIPLVIGSKSNAYSFSDFLHSPFYIVVNIYYKVRIYTHAKKRRPLIVYPQSEAFALPIESINNRKPTQI